MRLSLASTIATSTLAVLAISGCGHTSAQAGAGEQVTNQRHSENQTDQGGRPWVFDIEEETLKNENFRLAAWTGEYMQMTFMAIPPGEDIGLEAHPRNDQFIRIEGGNGRVLMGKTPEDLDMVVEVEDDWALFIPAGYWHNLENTGDRPLKVYSIYSPPEHPAGTVHPTKADDDHHHEHDDEGGE